MSTQLTAVPQFQLDWSKKEVLDEIKNLFAKELTNVQFEMYCGIAKTLDLNPFKREIFAVPFKGECNFIIARDAYRRNAQRQSDYDYHQSECVRANDEFRIVNGEIQHSFGLKDRGEIVGAYGICKRKASSKPSYVWITAEEYGKKKFGCWVTLPETMIKKVAEAQVLRMVFQELFAGTYSEDENELMQSGIFTQSRTDELRESIKDVSRETIEAQDADFDEISLESQIERVKSLLAEKQFDEERTQRALEWLKADSIDSLTFDQAQLIIEKLEKIKN